MTHLVYLINNVRSETDDVTVENLGHFGLFARFAQANIVDKRSIRTARVQDEKSLIFVDDHGVLPRQDFTVEQSIAGITLRKKSAILNTRKNWRLFQVPDPLYALYQFYKARREVEPGHRMGAN